MVTAGSAGHPTLGGWEEGTYAYEFYTRRWWYHVCQDRIRETYIDTRKTDEGHELGSRKAYNPVSELRLIYVYMVLQSAQSTTGLDAGGCSTLPTNVWKDIVK